LKLVGSDSWIVKYYRNHWFPYYVWQTSTKYCLNIDGFGLAIPEMSQNTLFYMSNTYIEAFLNFETAGSQIAIR